MQMIGHPLPVEMALALLACLLVPMLLAGIFAGPVVAFCRRAGLVAIPTARHAHVNPTPHGGGVLIVALAVPVLLLLVALWPERWSTFSELGVGPALADRAYLLVLVLASLPVAVIGWLDDVREVRASVRLSVHLVCVLAAALMLPPLFDFMPLALEKILLVLGWGWFVNLFNFMNGADGFAETEAVFICLIVALLVPSLAPVCMVIAGATIGFLRVNWHPAKIFMGDVGSTWLGFMLGGLLLAGVVDNTWWSLWQLAAVPLVFCFDATYTLIARIAGGYPVWQPHKTFWFHRILALGWRHDELVWGLIGINLILSGFLFAEVYLHVRGVALVGGLAILVFLAYMVRRYETKKG